MDLVHIPTPKYLIGYAESRIGGRCENQDLCGAKETPFGFLVTVCDGMGGGPGGKTASTLAVQEILNGITEGNKEDELPNIVIKAILRANMAIYNKSVQIPELKGMGSTCTVLLINKDCAVIAHVGDSRVYQLRGKNKIFRTFDHSMVFDMVSQGIISEEQARLSAQSNVITRALGIKPDLEVDIVVRPYRAKDRFVLCSDGIHGTMPEKEFIEYVTDRKISLGAVTDNIATIIDGKGREEGGGHDNLTIAIIETKINSTMKETLSTKIKLIISVLSLVCCISLILNVAHCIQEPATNNTEKILAKTDSIVDSLTDSLIHLKDSMSVINDKTLKIQKTNRRLTKDNDYLKNKLKHIQKNRK